MAGAGAAGKCRAWRELTARIFGNDSRTMHIAAQQIQQISRKTSCANQALIHSPRARNYDTIYPHWRFVFFPAWVIDVPTPIPVRNHQRLAHHCADRSVPYLLCSATSPTNRYLSRCHGTHHPDVQGMGYALQEKPDARAPFHQNAASLHTVPPCSPLIHLFIPPPAL